MIPFFTMLDAVITTQDTRVHLQSINPSSGALIEEFPVHGHGEIEAMLRKASEAQKRWRREPIRERGARMMAAADILERHADRYARIMTDEMGKPVSQARAEVEKCAWVCRYYAEHAERFLSSEPVDTDATHSYVRFDPLGVVLAIMPWNFPFWQVFRFAAPALMAGNTAILKHASNVSRSALEIEGVFREAGFPGGAFTTILAPSSSVPDIIADDRIAAVTLTGSEPAGSSVASCAGRHLKKTVLELGGSDPFIVLEGADIENAAMHGASARCINNGQSCIAAKRFIIVEAVADAFERAFVNAMAGMLVGDPADPDTRIGPIAREDLLADLHRQVTESVNAGAFLLLGGRRMPREGFYYEATVLGNVRPGMPAYEEELFGPVASVIRAANTADAVRIANDCRFGLGASIWSEDAAEAERAAADIQAGSVFINGIVKSDPRLPFGGVKRSGYGRELSHYGIKEFVNIRAVWVR